MNNRYRETLITRCTSAAFATLALAVFKPLEIKTLGASVYLHLFVIWILGVATCYVTEGILRYGLRIPSSLEKGVGYIIRRNLAFQLINTPLVALYICVYLHFVLLGHTDYDPLTFSGYIRTLIMLAFCSFAIGLYWRFKFRARFLEMELEEVRSMNDSLVKTQEEARKAEEKSSLKEEIILSGSTSEAVRIKISDLLYIEAVGNYIKVYQMGQDCALIRSTLSQAEEVFKDYPMITRCHRAFLVNLIQVERIEVKPGGMTLKIKQVNDYIPVSRSHVTGIKSSLKNFDDKIVTSRIDRPTTPSV